MKPLNQFDNIIEVLKNMPPDEKAALIQAHQKFHQLKEHCQAKNMIEILPKMTGIRVLKNTPEVKELKTVIDKLKPAGFKWLKKGEKEK